jgi:Voltage gated chloride channel
MKAWRSALRCAAIDHLRMHGMMCPCGRRGPRRMSDPPGHPASGVHGAGNLLGPILHGLLAFVTGQQGPIRGVFAPSLFIGAMLGSAYGDLVHPFLPGLVAPAGAYGLVGMGAVFAGAASTSWAGGSPISWDSSPSQTPCSRFPKGFPRTRRSTSSSSASTRRGRDALPVVDADGTLRGIVTAHEVEQAIRENARHSVQAGRC